MASVVLNLSERQIRELLVVINDKVHAHRVKQKKYIKKFGAPFIPAPGKVDIHADILSRFEPIRNQLLDYLAVFNSSARSVSNGHIASHNKS